MRGKGHIADSRPEMDAHIVQLVGAAPAITLPPSFDMLRHFDSIQDQQRSEFCVGYGFSTDLMVYMRGTGVPASRPSPKFAVDVGHLIQSGMPLRNEGVAPRCVFAGSLKYGVVSESKWPLLFDDDGNCINAEEPPPWDVFRAGSEFVVSGYFRIPPGPFAVHQAKQTLSTGHPICFAMDVTELFENLPAAEDPWAGDDEHELTGSHMMCILGYRPGAFLVANSWGMRWGDHGFFWLDEKYFGTSNDVRDRIVITGDAL